MSISKDDILSVTRAVTKEWTKQRKAEERGRRSRSSRLYVYSNRQYFTQYMEEILPDAYEHASGGGRYTVSKRQLYYACRDKFQESVGEPLGYQYFANTLLVQYLNRRRPGWKITADPRGSLLIPNAEHEVRIPCGTIDIDNYLARDALSNAIDDVLEIDELKVETHWPALSPGIRYQGVLYIEKEGFGPLLKEAQIAEKYDLAILSCKGQSVVAARKFIDHVCYVGGGVPLFVVHDMDKAGFEIAQRLTRVSDWARDADRVTYEFRNQINVTDLGLRLSDAEEYELLSETCKFKGGFARDSICTAEEREFLRGGERIELNAFTSPQFIEWLEGKLNQHLPKRLIPTDSVLETAYRRALIVAEINASIEETLEDAKSQYGETPLPKTIRRQLIKQMKEEPAAWDQALYAIAESKVSRDRGD